MSPTTHARERIGAAVRTERKSRSLSIEAAAKAGGIGHMTWRKIEQGGSVHDQSYYAVDRAFGWQGGHTLATVKEGGVDLTPAPPADPGLVTVADSSQPGRNRGLPTENLESAFELVLQGIDSLTLSELKAVSKIVDREISEKDQYSELALQAINNLNRYPFSYVEKYITATSPDVSQRYNRTLVEYMGAWEAVQNYAYMIRDLSENRPGAKLSDIKDLYETLTKADTNLTEVMQRLNKAEQDAIADLGESIPIEATNEKE